MPKLQQRIQAGFTIIELLIVIAIIGILATLVLTNFQGAQAKGRDTVRKNDINAIYTKLEEFYNENSGYPDGALSTTVFPGIDSEALNDADGNAIVESFTDSTTQPTLTLTTTNEYAYAAFDCANTTAQSPVGATCQKYIVGTFMEQESQYEKTSLN